MTSTLIRNLLPPLMLPQALNKESVKKMEEWLNEIANLIERLLVEAGRKPLSNEAREFAQKVKKRLPPGVSIDSIRTEFSHPELQLRTSSVVTKIFNRVEIEDDRVLTICVDEMVRMLVRETMRSFVGIVKYSGSKDVLTMDDLVRIEYQTKIQAVAANPAFHELFNILDHYTRLVGGTR